MQTLPSRKEGEETRSKGMPYTCHVMLFGSYFLLFKCFVFINISIFCEYLEQFTKGDFNDTATQVRNLNVILVQWFVVCVCFPCPTARLSNLFPLYFAQSGNIFKPTPTTLPQQWNVTASAYRYRILNCFGAIQFAEQSQFKHVFTNDRQ